MYLVAMGIFDSVKRGIQRVSDPLAPSELKEILDGRQESDLAGCWFGQTFSPRSGWGEGILAIFQDGSGAIYLFFRGSTGSRNTLHCMASWEAGSATNNFNDPTPLLVGSSGITFEAAKRYVPSNTPVPSLGELLLVIENFSNDYDDDGQNSWVSGASHKPGVVFSGIVFGASATALRLRCADRKGW
jgi:hypothetical protein